ncbi:hypothetical protein BROUX41_004111 [Berkeleyomyces rouxiae]|uniref:uncharacterized protein n=1 Tax=Berkeleyomyces rouxiae TaxID=2035830 RepID=UPI003B75E86F
MLPRRSSTIDTLRHITTVVLDEDPAIVWTSSPAAVDAIATSDHANDASDDMKAVSGNSDLAAFAAPSSDTPTESIAIGDGSATAKMGNSGSEPGPAEAAPAAAARIAVDTSIDSNTPVSPMSSLRISSSPAPEDRQHDASASSLPKTTTATTPKKTVKFSETTQTHTLPPKDQQSLSSSIINPRIAVWDINSTAPVETRATAAASAGILVPDDDEIFIFDNDNNMPSSTAPKLVKPMENEEPNDQLDATDDEDFDDLDGEGRDRMTPLRETFVSHSYVQALNIPLPPDHPDYGSSLANTPAQASVNKSFISGSLGSYKGKPLMMPILRDPTVQERVESLGQVSSFVGGLNGGSGVDESDLQSYRASLATASNVMRMAGASTSIGPGSVGLSGSMAYSGTPRSFTDPSPPMTGAEWTRQKREDFLVKRQQERQIREGSRAQKKAPAV